MLRVAAYARVSTDKDDQINSLTNQRSYFESCIKSHEDWEFAEVYFDEGVTGTQTKKRAGFNRMIDECKAGNIDLILTKEVSRFARNTVDTLSYTRMLKEYGVGVLFINDNIDTRENDGEFRLSIMASVAQEESRKTSERVKWGQRRAMENGVVFGNNSIFGFNVKNGILTVNDAEAEVVRLIFHKYINEGKGTHVIARELYESEIKPPRASQKFWSSAMISRILRNEKYVGDLLQKKYITIDYLTHKKVQNNGEKIFIPNHHEAIIDRNTWDRTQEELERRSMDAAAKKKYSNRYWCSGKIICGACGARFVIRRSRKKSGEYITWACHSRAEHGNSKTDSNGNMIGCNMRMINNKSLLDCMRFVTAQTCGDFDSVAEEIIAEINEMSDECDEPLIDLTKHRIRETENKKLRMLDSYFAGQINENEMKKLRDVYDEELERLNVKLEQREDRHNIIRDRQGDLFEIRNVIKENAVHFESVYGEILDGIVVYDEYMIIILKYLDFAFKIRYSAHGYKEKYTTVIEECEIVRVDE
ncbi:MAG: recombinase family protein [Hominilimicola sp.]